MDSQQLSFFAAGSLASLTALQATEKPAPMTATYGESSPDSYTALGPAGSSPKTCWVFFPARGGGSSGECSGTWPGSGSMRNGACSQQQPWAHLTSGAGSLSWPTPMANDAKNAGMGPGQLNRDGLPGALLKAGEVGKMNPAWVEWLMGFPVGWTDLEPAAMPLFPEWPSTSAG